MLVLISSLYLFHMFLMPKRFLRGSQGRVPAPFVSDSSEVVVFRPDENIQFNKVTNSLVHGIISVDNNLFHMNILQCQNLTLSHITINAPGESLNTNGIHIGRSTGIKITDSDIKTGDDYISMGDGSQQMTIEKVKCGPGYGISIGRLGNYHDEQPIMGVFSEIVHLQTQ
ncbi:hypothetical protein AgCh_031891 [Apium graveolens]